MNELKILDVIEKFEEELFKVYDINCVRIEDLKDKRVYYIGDNVLEITIK